MQKVLLAQGQKRVHPESTSSTEPLTDKGRSLGSPNLYLLLILGEPMCFIVYNLTQHTKQNVRSGSETADLAA